MSLRIAVPESGFASNVSRLRFPTATLKQCVARGLKNKRRFATLSKQGRWSDKHGIIAPVCRKSGKRLVIGLDETG